MTGMTGWIEVSPAAMRGQGLKPYEAGEITSLFDWAENPQGRSSHLMPHRAQFIVDVVRIEANVVHQPSKPGDEIVAVLNGVLELTDDGSDASQRFSAGELVLIPLGWAGMYRVIPDGDDFLELALVPGNYFDVAAARAPTGARPRALIIPVQPGIHELHRGRYLVQAVVGGTAGAVDCSVGYEATCDEVIYVRGGNLTVAASGRHGQFEAGSVLVLPAGFSGQMQRSTDFQGLVARWLQD
jgi:uncharacterized cupin superfamily protein